MVATYDEGKARQFIERAFKECERIEACYSRFIEGNELASLNAHIGEWMKVSKELYELIAFGSRVKANTNGAFDLSVKTILEGWGYDSNYSLQEHEAGKCGAIEFDEGRRVKIHAEIELGGLGKGYALDRMMNELAEFNNVCINAGGDIFARGKNGEEPWKIAFEHPLDLSKAIGFVEVDGMALGCTSPSRRKWRNRHHIVDPKLGEPANNMLAVYTQAEAGLLADAYSTALFALGYERAKALLPSLPIDAMLVGTEGKIFRSDGFKGEPFMEEN